MFVKDGKDQKNERSLKSKLENKLMGLKNIVSPPRNITAKAYIIYRTGREGGMGKVILSENSKNRQ
jgi:hypothetical protein